MDTTQLSEESNVTKYIIWKWRTIIPVNNSYVNCSGRCKWRMIIKVNFPISAFPKKPEKGFPLKPWFFFRLLLSNSLNWKIYCDDHSSLSSTLYHCSSHTNYFIYASRWSTCTPEKFNNLFSEISALIDFAGACTHIWKLGKFQILRKLSQEFLIPFGSSLKFLECLIEWKSC